MCNFCDSLSIFDNWNGWEKVNIKHENNVLPIIQMYQQGSYFYNFLVNITVNFFFFF